MKFPAVESVFSGVSQHTPEKGIRVKRRVDLLEIEPTPFFEDPRDFLEPQIPLFQVMDDPEIEHRIETARPIRQMLGIGHKKEWLVENGTRESPSRKLYHDRIDVYGVHPFGMKVLTHESCPVTASAADFKTLAPPRHGSEPFEVPGLKALDKPPHRAVYPDSFGPIDFHWVFKIPFLSAVWFTEESS
jgi:hypothetical protein